MEISHPHPQHGRSQVHPGFDGQPTPLGYAAFAFALGVTAGALIRRTIPAMAVTLAVFAALQVAMPLWIRPHFAPADRTVISVALGATPEDQPARAAAP